MLHLQNLNGGERRTLATLARLGEAETLVPLQEDIARSCDTLEGKGLAMQPDDYEVGYRLTTQGAALAEGL